MCGLHDAVRTQDGTTGFRGSDKQPFKVGSPVSISLMKFSQLTQGCREDKR